MPCYHPMPARRIPGVKALQFGPGQGDPIQLPCGQCIGCRLERSRQWAVRIMHESKSHEQNCFITLTYNEQHVPPDHSLIPEHFQRFIKRLRKTGAKIRYYGCGEYGDQQLRPHYHACIFGTNFPDRLPVTTETAAYPLFISPTLMQLWPYGDSKIGDLTFESAAYVARYCTKKINGKDAEKHYTRVIESTGEIVQVEPEFARMSLKPGIGSDWYDKYNSEVYPHDRVIIRGKKCKPPRYYDEKYKKAHEQLHELLKEKRILDAQQYLEENRHRSPQLREEFVKLKQKHFQQRKL